MECVATCRPGLEAVLSEEIRALGVREVRPAKRAVHFETDQRGLYRLNMGLRCAIQILVPIRTFNARDYQLLYFQSRRTNWHQYFTVGKTLRIDVNGRSETLRNTQYVIHRVKDGIVDTFRKLSEGIRPSIDKAEPEIHVVAHLDGTQVTLCLDSSGVPLFKRGYRLEHGEAPIKEDLAAGMLLLCGLRVHTGLMDPMCGAGTFLFEGWLILNEVAPNLHRGFACQHWMDYDPVAFEEERAALAAKAVASVGKGHPLVGFDSDPAVIELANGIREASFPTAAIEFHAQPFQEASRVLPGGLLMTNPPYGMRMGSEEDLGQLYRDLGNAAKQLVPGGQLALFTTNRKAARQVRLKHDQARTLFNGALEGLLYQYSLREA